MSEIQIISKESHKTLSNTMDNTAVLSPSQPAVVLVKINIQDVAQVKRDGTNAVEPYRVCRRVNILRDYPDDKIKIYP